MTQSGEFTDMQSLAPIVIMAGGTGGHIFPALAVARVLQAKGCQVIWIGTENSMESRLVPQNQIAIRFIKIKALRGKGLWAKLLLPFRLVIAISQALTILKNIKPAAVLGMGGFVTGPGGIAAWLLRKPLLIHEQNAIAGMTNRYLARIASDIYEAFPNSFGYKTKVKCVGNPLRQDIVLLHKQDRQEYSTSRALHLLVVGGSLGALVLNETVPAAIASLIADHKITPTALTIRHQSGERTYTHAHDAYLNNNVDAEVIEFIDSMSDAYIWADVVICRAGALTVSEVAAAGLPAIFVPFPYAVDDHQNKNAQVLAAAGAAEVIEQKELTPKVLAKSLLRFFREPGSLKAMSKISKEHAQLNATEIIARQCLHYAEAAA
jgi:UDP-N-acetylglucosamine--N-acetylmuramyl-(pentapeptide) pyrophosphoryl-undecaprenol N-acetylglucosamine transferase